MSVMMRWLETALPSGQTHIMLGLGGQNSSDRSGMTDFVLYTDNIEETCATLKEHGVTFIENPSTQLWGTWAQITDTDGNEFGIWVPAA